MTTRERKQIVENDIREYEIAVQLGDKSRIQRAVNGIHNTFIMICLWGGEDAEKLRQILLSADADK